MDNENPQNDGMYEEARNESAAAENFSDALQSDPADASDYELIENVTQNAEQAEQTESEQENAEEQQQPQSKYEQAQLEQMAAQLGISAEKLSDPEIAGLCEAALDQLTAQQQAQPTDQATIDKQYSDHYEQLEKLVNDKSFMDERILTDFSDALSRCETPRQQMQVLAAGGINLIESYLPQALERHLEASLERILPGISSQFRESQAANVWDQVRGSDLAYAKLPDFGSKELVAAYESLEKENPWLNNLRPEPRMTYQQFLMRNAKIVAKLLSGQKVDHTAIEKAIETGRRQERQANQRINTSRAMGMGQRTGSAFQANNDGDDPIQRGYEEYKRRGGAFGK